MKNRISLLTFLIILFSCEKAEIDINNLNNNTISIFGHGGMGIGESYPVNSFESIMKCLNTGADGSEIDVQMTRDSVLVAYHADFLEDATNLKGSIIDKSWSEISQGQYSDPIYTGYKLISLDELFSNIPHLNNYTFTLDCHMNNANNDLAKYYRSFASAIDKISDKYNLKGNLFIESHQADFLSIMQNNKRDYRIFIIKSPFELGFEIATKMNLYGITIPSENITAEQVQQAHMHNLFVTVWNTRSKKENREAIEKNPDHIQTDKVEYLIKILAN
ncbi:MAG: hypothetical protein K9G76_07260 [Bacteroidales bacterium]|nr:hypothetical protein [Bacteroidales bacterium]MCF8404585.1 hypothetical protein [Bacteroidales bacterium]